MPAIFDSAAMPPQASRRKQNCYEEIDILAYRACPPPVRKFTNTSTLLARHTTRHLVGYVHHLPPVIQLPKASLLLWAHFRTQAKDDRVKSLESTLIQERARSVGGDNYVRKHFCLVRINT